MHTLLAEALEITNFISKLANSEDWSAIEEEVRKRQSTLEKYFSIRPLPDSHDIIQSAAKIIRENDASVRARMDQCKQKAIKENLHLRAKAHAIRQYHHNAD